MQKYSDKTHALFMAAVWTLSAILFLVRTIWNLTPPGSIDPLLLAVAVLSVFNTIMWWINYAKKRQEAGHEEKDSP